MNVKDRVVINILGFKLFKWDFPTMLAMSLTIALFACWVWNSDGDETSCTGYYSIHVEERSIFVKSFNKRNRAEDSQENCEVLGKDVSQFYSELFRQLESADRNPQKFLKVNEYGWSNTQFLKLV